MARLQWTPDTVYEDWVPVINGLALWPPLTAMDTFEKSWSTQYDGWKLVSLAWTDGAVYEEWRWHEEWRWEEEAVEKNPVAAMTPPAHG